MILTTIMMKLVGMWMLRRWIFPRYLQGEAEPQEEPIPADGPAIRIVMTREDTETLRKMYDEVMVLREFCKGLQEELTKKQNMLTNTRDEARIWQAKAEINPRDLQRNFRYAEIFTLPHGGIWCADLNCARSRTDGAIHRYHSCGLCGTRLGDPSLDFRDDSSATVPPSAWRIGDLADARSWGEVLT
eukprot:s1334_g2.t1